MLEKPLESKTILITRARTQAGMLSMRLEELGATVVEIPTIEIVPRDSPELDGAIRNLRDYDWIFFTSVNGVDIFLRRVDELGSLSDVSSRICAIGPATRRQVEEYGLSVDLQPSLYQAEGILQDFAAYFEEKIANLRILLPRASQAREVLPNELRRMGAQVDVIPVYDTVVPSESAHLLSRILSQISPDLVTFTSSSTVRNFASLAGDQINLSSIRGAAIGAITAETAARYQVPIVLQSPEATIPSFVEAICRYFTDSSSETGQSDAKDGQ
jgi:uroporphyrinogen III methyltransferase/synthase